MNPAALSLDAAGYLLTNRAHIFVMPVFLTYFWNQAFGLALPASYYLMIAFTTAGGYIYNMLTDAAEDGVNYNRRYRLVHPGDPRVKVVIFICFLMGFLLALPGGWWFVLYGGAANLLASLYSHPLPLPGSDRRVRIKELPFVKNLYAGFFWSVALVLTPHVYTQTPPGTLALVAVLVRFGLNYFVELSWDLRDLPGDRLAGVRTAPQVIGEAASYRLLQAVHVATCAGILWGVWTGLLPPGFLIAAIHLPTGLVYLRWYRGLVDKEWASHLYILYAGGLVSAGIAWNWAATAGS